jgi:hypothetical protein
MNFLNYLFGSHKTKKEKRKRIFISFAIEDKNYRDHLITQACNKRSPFEFLDMSVKEPYPQLEWKQRCRTKLKRCHGVIVLLSNNTYHSSGVRWEIKCATEEGIPIVGMHIKKNKKSAIPPELEKNKVIEWTWENIQKFIKQL